MEITKNNISSDIIETEPRQYSTLNLGPTHPATHGIFQNVLQMDGEIIMSAESTVGYIHRAFEKFAEAGPKKQKKHRPYNPITPITDRLN
jgi:NADH-quinone oxidoreductase subunit D